MIQTPVPPSHTHPEAHCLTAAPLRPPCSHQVAPNRNTLQQTLATLAAAQNSMAAAPATCRRNLAPPFRPPAGCRMWPPVDQQRCGRLWPESLPGVHRQGIAGRLHPRPPSNSSAARHTAPALKFRSRQSAATIVSAVEVTSTKVPKVPNRSAGPTAPRRQWEGAWEGFRSHQHFYPEIAAHLNFSCHAYLSRSHPWIKCCFVSSRSNATRNTWSC